MTSKSSGMYINLHNNSFLTYAIFSMKEKTTAYISNIFATLSCLTLSGWCLKMPYPPNFWTTEAIAMKIGTNVTDYKSIKILSIMISEEKERKTYGVPFYLNFTFFV